jgi:hypothetical protein
MLSLEPPILSIHVLLIVSMGQREASDPHCDLRAVHKPRNITCTRPTSTSQARPRPTSTAPLTSSSPSSRPLLWINPQARGLTIYHERTHSGPNRITGLRILRRRVLPQRALRETCSHPHTRASILLLSLLVPLRSPVSCPLAMSCHCVQ